MPLNLSEEEIGKRTAVGIVGVRKILQENLKLEINAQRRVASIDDPVRRHWTETTLEIRDGLTHALSPECAHDEDQMMNAFFADSRRIG